MNVVRLDYRTVIIMDLHNTMTIDAFSYQSWEIFLAGNVQGGGSI